MWERMPLGSRRHCRRWIAHSGYCLCSRTARPAVYSCQTYRRLLRALPYRPNLRAGARCARTASSPHYRGYKTLGAARAGGTSSLTITMRRGIGGWVSRVEAVASVGYLLTMKEGQLCLSARGARGEESSAWWERGWGAFPLCPPHTRPPRLARTNPSVVCKTTPINGRGTKREPRGVSSHGKGYAIL